MADFSIFHRGVKVPEKSSVLLKCGKCGREGTAHWETNPETLPNSPKRFLMGVSGGFYERVQKTNRSLTEIVCGSCEAIHPNEGIIS